MKRKKLLILDIDNTLLFAVRHKPGFDRFQADYCLLDTREGLCHVPINEIERGDKEKYKLYNVFLRPSVREFLAFCRKHFTLAVYTTAWLDHPMIATQYFFPDLKPDENPWLFVWSRDQCVSSNWGRKKCLRAVMEKYDYGEEEILVVDDQETVWIPEGEKCLPENIIPIMEYGSELLLESWSADNVLPALECFLHQFIDADDVRKIEKKKWENQYPHIIDQKVKNQGKACISYPCFISGELKSLCGDQVRIAGAFWDIPEHNICDDCVSIVEKMHSETAILN